MRNQVSQRWYCDGLQFADAKDREQDLPPTGVVGFRNEARVVKDRSPVTEIDVDRALISFKEMPIAPMKANHDGGEVACGQIGDLAVERAALINHFERGVLGIVEFDGIIWEPCRDRPHGHRSLLCI